MEPPRAISESKVLGTFNDEKFVDWLLVKELEMLFPTSE